MTAVRVDGAVQPKLGDPAIAGVPLLCAMIASEYRAERVDGWLPEVGPRPAETNHKRELKDHASRWQRRRRGHLAPDRLLVHRLASRHRSPHLEGVLAA